MAKIVPSLPIPVTLMKEVLSSSKTNKVLCISSQHVSVASYGYVPSSPILVTLMLEALSSSEMSVLTRATWRNIPGCFMGGGKISRMLYG
jgi:hypothetical protein